MTVKLLEGITAVLSLGKTLRRTRAILLNYWSVATPHQ